MINTFFASFLEKDAQKSFALTVGLKSSSSLTGAHPLIRLRGWFPLLSRSKFFNALGVKANVNVEGGLV